MSAAVACCTLLPLLIIVSALPAVTGAAATFCGLRSKLPMVMLHPLPPLQPMLSLTRFTVLMALRNGSIFGPPARVLKTCASVARVISSPPAAVERSEITGIGVKIVSMIGSMGLVASSTWLRYGAMASPKNSPVSSVTLSNAILRPVMSLAGSLLVDAAQFHSSLKSVEMPGSAAVPLARRFQSMSTPALRVTVTSLDREPLVISFSVRASGSASPPLMSMPKWPLNSGPASSFLLTSTFRIAS